MRLHSPDSLWSLVAVAVVAAGYLVHWRRRARLLERIGDPVLVRQMCASSSLPAQVGRAVLVLLGLTALVLALARPQLGSAEVRSERRGIDLVVALDISRSMLAQDVRPSRLQAARLAVEAALPELAGSRIGLVPFAGVAFPQCPLTADQSAIRVYLRGLDPSKIPVGGTAIGRAIAEATELLTGRRTLAEAARLGRDVRPLRRARTQAILLITDGEDHQSDPTAAADAAAADGIRIYTVGLGTVAGEPLPEYHPDGTLQGYAKDRSGKVIYSRLDESTLRAIAERTGGEYLPAAGARPLPARLTDALRGLEKETLGEGVRRHMDERYAALLVPALLLLALELLLGDRRRRRLA